MAEVRRFWSEKDGDLIIAVLHSGYVFLNLPDGATAEIDGECKDAISCLRQWGYDPRFYDEFSSWEEYDEYVTIGA